MPLPSSGVLTINDIAGEFGGTIPHSLSEYYGVDAGIPTSGTISIQDFYGATAITIPIVTYLGGNSGSSSSYSVGATSRNNRVVVSIEGHSSSSIGTASCTISGGAASIIAGGGASGWEQCAIGYRTVTTNALTVSVAWSRPSALSYVHRVYLFENVNSLTPYRSATGSQTFTPLSINDKGVISLASDDSVTAPTASVTGGTFAYDANNVVTNMRYRGGDFSLTTGGSVTVSLSAQDRCYAIWN